MRPPSPRLWATGMRVLPMIVLATCLALPAVALAQAAPPPGAPPAGRGRGAGPPPRIVTFEARPASIKPGESALLVWHVENPAAPAIEPIVGRVIPRGTARVAPSATTTYTLTNGTVTSTVTVTVAGTKPIAAATGTLRQLRTLAKRSHVRRRGSLTSRVSTRSGAAADEARPAAAPRAPALRPPVRC